MKTKVFVYGSLKEGYSNHRLLEDSGASFLGGYITPPEYTMVSCGGFPGVLEGGDTPITGEVYEISDNVFKRLDHLEGYPGFYDRKKITTEHGEAWMYIINDTYRDHTPVPEGNW